MSAVRACRRLLPFFLLAIVIQACGDGAKKDPAAEVEVTARSTEAITLAGPSDTSLVIPPGATDEDVTIVLTVPQSRRSAPADAIVVGPAVRLEPEGKTFLAPLELTIPITPSAIPAGKTIDDVVVVRAPQGTDATAFVPLPTRREGNAVVATTEHFSDFLAIIPATPTPGPVVCMDMICAPTETCELCPFDCGNCVPTGDTVPPTVVAVEQPTITTGVRGDAAIAVRFDEAIRENTVTTTTFAVTSGTSAALAGEFVVADSLVTFTPNLTLLPSTTYTITIAGVRDLAGNLLAPAFSTTITTGTGTAISLGFPANGATNVAQSASIGIAFDGPVSPATFVVQPADGSCTGSLRISANSFATCLGGSRYFEANDTYMNVTLARQLPGSASIAFVFMDTTRDPSGFSLRTSTYGFTVETDATNPSFVSSVPAENEQEANPNAPIVLTFSEPIAAASVTATSVALTQDGQPVACARSVVGDQVTLTPAAPLVERTNYMVRLTGVTDLAGNPVPAGPGWSFRTAGSQLITTTSSYPRDFDGAIHPRADIVIGFESSIDPATFTMQATDSTTCSGTIRVSDGTTCFGGVLTHTGTNEITVRPTSTLPLSTGMTVRAADGPTNANGYPYADVDLIRFWTGPRNAHVYRIGVAAPSWYGNLGGTSGADAICANAWYGGTWKAFVMTSTRYACTDSYCGTNGGTPADTSLDWVLVPNVTYATSSGAELFTTHPVAPIPQYPSDLVNVFNASLDAAFYFGGTDDWMLAPDNCADFTDMSTSELSTTGHSNTLGSTWRSAGSVLCDTDLRIFCVEQPGNEPATH